MRLQSILAAAAALMIAACAQTESGSSQGDSDLTMAQREKSISRAASVEAVDMDSREVSLRFDDGEIENIVAGPEVRNLAQLEVGDIVVVEYFESVVLEMTDAEVSETANAAVYADRAAEGDKPGGSVAAGVSMVVEFVSYDAASGYATYVEPGGNVAQTEVNPAMREFVQARKPGDRVELTFIQAVAISIAEIDS